MHVSRRDGAIWSSKFGDWIRATHPRTRLGPNGAYGNIILNFRPRHAAAVSMSEIATVEHDTLAASKATDLVERIAQAFPTLTDGFDAKWKAWEHSWATAAIDIQVLSLSSAFAQGPEWDALVKMGPSILPQVVKKLASGNIFGCNLCKSSSPAATFPPASYHR